MIEYRRATIYDVPELMDLARAGLTLRGYVEALPLHVDNFKIRQMIVHFVTMTGHFQMVAVKDGKVVGALAMYVAEMPWFERAEGHVMMCFATVPSTVRRLVREMMAYVDADIRIRRVCWSMNEGAEKLVAMAARRFGFGQRLDNLIYYKGI